MRINKKDLIQLVKYGVGGGTGAVLNLGAVYIFTHFAGFYYLYSYFIGAILNYTFNFFYHRSITFETKNKTAKRAAYYYVSNIVLGGMAIGLATLLKNYGNINYLVANLMATIIVIVINYVFSKFVTFNAGMK